MTAFAGASDLLFADPNPAREAWYQDSDGHFIKTRVILRRPDEISEFGPARLLSNTIRVDIQMTDVPDLRP